MSRVLLDTNVILDVLQHREPWCADGEKIFQAIAQKQISGSITAKQAADIYYFSRRQFLGEENADAKARKVMSKLFYLFELTDSLGSDCLNALMLENNDYEDAMLITSAERAGMDYIVTRDPKHFKNSPVRTLSPKSFLKELGK